MCCDACSGSTETTTAPTTGEGFVESEITLNESIKISIKANKDEVSKIIVSSWFEIDEERIYETEAVYNEETKLYEVEINFGAVNGSDGTYYFDASIYDAQGNMRYIRLTEVAYTSNGISRVTTNRTPEGNVEVTVEAVEGGEIYISTNGEAPTEDSEWMPYTMARTYTLEDEGNSISEVQVYYRSSTIVTEPEWKPTYESVGSVSWNTSTTYTYTDEYATYQYRKDYTNQYVWITLCTPKGDTVHFPDEINGMRVLRLEHKNSDTYNIFGKSSTYSIVKNMTLPNGLQTIGSRAFYDCTGLTGNLIIPDSVTTIGDMAFLFCEGLTGEVKLSKNITDIGYGLFSNCTKLTRITVAHNNPNYKDIDGILFSKDETAIIQAPGGLQKHNYIIPNTVKKIQNQAFRNCKLLTGTLTIGENVETIGDAAFYDCNGLTGDLIIPNNVTKIDSHAFHGCGGFTGDLIIPNNVTEINSHAFYGCGGFTGDLIISDNVTEINSYAFYGCGGFTGDLVISDNVTKINSYAFYGCGGFTGDLVIGNNVTTIGKDSFTHCIGFNGSLKIGAKLTNISNLPLHLNFNYINVSEESLTYKSIDGILFSIDGTRLIRAPRGMQKENFVIPNGVTSIGASAFTNCDGFTGSLTIPNRITSIGYEAFRGCSGFTGNLIIPDSVTSIGTYAFYDCDGFTGNLLLPNSLTSLGYYTFFDCDGFTGELVIPDSVTSIGMYAFYNCGGFTGDLVIPNRVTSIGKNAFHNCDGFTGDLIIPNRVTSIGDGAFAGLRHVTIIEVDQNNSEYKSIEGILFKKDDTSLIQVPAGMQRENYVIPDSVTSIRDSAFKNCDGFTGDLVIPNSVTSIGDAAFFDCDGFTGDLIIGDSVTSIGYAAFSGCSGFLGGVVIPSVTSTVGDQAFINCTGLDYVLFTRTTPWTTSWNYRIADSGKVYVLTNEMVTTYNKTNNWIKENGGKGVFPALGVTSLKETIKANTTFKDMGVTVCGLPMQGDENIRAVATYQLQGSNSMSTTLDTSVPGIYTATYTLQLKNASGEYENVTNTSGVLEQKTRTIEVVASDYVPSENVEWVTTGTNASKTYTDSYGTFKYYKSSGDEYAKIIECAPKGTTVKFPDTIDGAHVIHIENANNNNNIFNSQNNTSITEILLPINLETIGKRAFYSCQAIKNQLKLPQTLKYIGNQAFHNCVAIKGNLIISNSVTTMESNAFSSCKEIRHVTLPTGITIIKSNTFQNCSSLKGPLEIPSNITIIESGAFQNCTSLGGEFVIPESVTTIGTDAFENTGFTKVTIPKTLTSLSGNVFGASKNLKYIEVVDENPIYKDINGIVYTQTEDTIVAVPAGMSGDEYRILGSVTKVDYGAFNGCDKFTGSLVLHEGIIEIGNKGFYNCTGFTGGLILPDSLDKVGSYAFSHCTGLSGNLVIHDGITSVSNNAFEYLEGMKGTLTIGSGLKSISNVTFQYSLFTGPLTIPTNITSVGASAYSHCTGFSGDLVLHNGITSVGNNAFEYLEGMTGRLTIGTGINTLNNYTFRGTRFTGDLVIPDNIKTIGQYVFYQSTGFKENLKLSNNLQSIGKAAFAGLDTHTNNSDNMYFTGTLELPSSLKTIGYYAFNGCRGFTGDLIIPEGVTTIEAGAFRNCSFDGKLVLPSTVTKLNSSTFYLCNNFTGNIIIPETLTTIGNADITSATKVDYILLTRKDAGVNHTSNSGTVLTDGKAFALTQEIADKYNAKANWARENGGNGVYPVLQLKKPDLEEVIYGTEFIDDGATVVGLQVDPNGLFRKTVKYTRYEDVAVASLDGLRFAENTAITTDTLTTTIPGTYTATYTLQMYNEASGDYYDINVSGDFYDASNGIPLEQVTREIEVLTEAPKVLDIEAISPESGEYDRYTEITFNVKWNLNPVVTEAPVLFIKFSGDGDVRRAEYVETVDNISTYTYTISPYDYGWLILDGYKGGTVNDEIDQDWISSEVTFDDEIFANRTYDALLIETTNGITTETPHVLFEDAINAISSITEIDEGTHSTVKVSGDQIIKNTLTISGDQKVKLDLNGSIVESEALVGIENYGILELTDTVGSGELVMYTYNPTLIANYGIDNASGDKSLILSNVNVNVREYDSNAIAILNYESGTVELNETNIQVQGYITYGILAYKESSIIVNNTTINSNAYRVYCISTNDITNIEIKDSTLIAEGRETYGILSDDSGLIEIKNSTIISNGYNEGQGINNAGCDIILGSNDGVINNDSVIIEAENEGIYNISGTIYFYDGNIKSLKYDTVKEIVGNERDIITPANTGVALKEDGDYTVAYIMEDTTAPVIENAAILTIYDRIEVSLIGITDIDGTGVNGAYLSTENVTPTLDDVWTPITQSTEVDSVNLLAGYEFTTYYVWVKDAAGNISAPITLTPAKITNNSIIYNEETKLNLVYSGDYTITLFDVADTEMIEIVDAEKLIVKGLQSGFCGIAVILENTDGTITVVGKELEVVDIAPQITKEPVDVYLEKPEEVTLSTDAIGTNLNYTWERRNIETGRREDLEDIAVYKTNIEGIANGVATQTVEIDIAEVGEIGFDYRVSSEENNDTFTVTVEDANGISTIIDRASGDLEWQTYIGEHEPVDGKVKLTFTYAKNGSVDKYEDYVLIKNFKRTEIKPYSYTSTFTTDERETIVTPDTSVYAGSTYTWYKNGSQFQSNNWNKNSTTASASITVKSVEPARIRFQYRVSSESNYDKLYIKIIGASTTTICNGISGNGSWQQVDRNIVPNANGEIKITMYYQKDGSQHTNDDRAYIQSLYVNGTEPVFSDVTEDVLTITSTNFTKPQYEGVNTKNLTIPKAIVDACANEYTYRCEVSNTAGLSYTRRATVSIINPNEFITEWYAENGETLTLPIPSNESNAFIVDWGDGTKELFTIESFPSHTYEESAPYQIKITGTVKEFGYYGTERPDEDSEYYSFTQRIMAVTQWGNIGAERFGFAHTNLEYVDSYIPEGTFANVTDMSYMFYNCRDLQTLNLTNIDTSNVINVDNMFEGTSNLQYIILGEKFDNLTGKNMFKDMYGSIIMQKTLKYRTDEVAEILDAETIGLEHGCNIYVNDLKSETLYEEAWKDVISADKIRPILELEEKQDIIMYDDRIFASNDCLIAGFYTDRGTGENIANLKDDGYTFFKESNYENLVAGNYQVKYTINYSTDINTKELMSITRKITVLETPSDDWLARETYYDLTWKDEYSGDIENPYLIKDAHDLAGISKWVADGETFEGKYFKLENDIDMSAHIWVPIGGRDISVKDGNYYYSSDIHYFAGNFDGNNHTISGLYYKQSGNYGNYVALFGKVIINENVEIKNLTINDSFLNGEYNVAGLIANFVNSDSENVRLKINNITIDVELDGWNYVSGLISSYVEGVNISNVKNINSIYTMQDYATGLIFSGKDVNIINFTNLGDIGAMSSALGIAYSLEDSTIKNSYNKGSIESVDIPYFDTYACGLVMDIQNTIIEDCYNEGEVRGQYLAGIIYSANNSTIKNVYNKGNIIAYDDGSGIVHSVENSTISNVYNEGQVGDGQYTNPSYATGIVYEMRNSTLNNSYNKGKMNSYYISSGIAYSVENSTISNCYNVGRFSSRNLITGFAYSASDSIINNSYNMANIVSNESNIAGFIEIANNTTISDVYNIGNLKGSSNVVGLIRNINGGSITNSYNSGEIISDGISCGVIINAEGTNIDNIYNLAPIVASNDAIGLIEYASNSNLYNLYNRGKISGEENAATTGLVRYLSYSNLYNSYNTGELIGTSIGGLVNSLESSNIYNSYNAGKLSGDNVAAIAQNVSDYETSSILQNNYYLEDGNRAIHTIEANEPILTNLTSFTPSGDGFELTTTDSYTGTTNLLDELNCYVLDNIDLGVFAWNISGDVNNGYPYHDELLIKIYEPSNFTASKGDSETSGDNNSSNSITLTWDANGNSIYSKYEIKVVNSNGDWETISTDATSPFIHTGLTENTAYEYNIRAYNSLMGYTNFVYAEGFTNQIPLVADFIKDTIRPTITNIKISTSSNTINSNGIVNVGFEASDENYDLGATKLDKDTIIIKVGDTIIEDAIVEMTKVEIASGERFSFNLRSISGFGELQLIVPVGSIADKVGNVNLELEIPTGVNVDDTKPDTVNNFKASGDSDLSMIITFEKPDPTYKVVIEELNEDGEWVILSENAPSPLIRPGLDEDKDYEYRAHVISETGKVSDYTYTTGYISFDKEFIVIRNDKIKPELVFVSVNPVVEYISSHGILTLILNATDANYEYNTELLKEEIIVMVDGNVNNNVEKTITKSNITSGETYQIVLTNITGSGDLSIAISGDSIIDKAGNGNDEIFAPADLMPKVVNGTISDTAPDVTVDDNVITVTNRQDSIYEIAKIEYQYRVSGETEFITSEDNVIEDTLADTEYEVRTVVTDIIGNIQESQITTVKTEAMDNSIITITADIEDFTSGDVNVTINYSDSKFNKEYSLDNSIWHETESGEFTLVITKNTTVYARLSDGKTSTASVSYVVDNIDKEKPIIGSVAVTPVGKANSKEMYVSGIADQGVSGVKGYYISKVVDLTKATWTELTETEFTYNVTENGTYYVWVIDNAGNISAAKIVIVNNIAKAVEDFTIPSSVTVEVGNRVSIPMEYEGEPKDITYTSANEEIVGIEPNIRQVVGVSVGETTVNIIFTNYDGTTIEKSIKVIVTPVTLTSKVTIDGAEYKGKWVNQDVDVELSTNGAKPVDYKVKVGKDGEWAEIDGLVVNSITGKGEITYTEDFSGEIYFIGYNSDGNVITTVTTGDVIRIDKTAPIIGRINNDVRENSMIIEIVDSEDELSGIKEYEIGIYLDNVLLAEYSGDEPKVTFSGLVSSTTYTIKYEIKDNAGNTTGLVNGGSFTTEKVIKTVTYDYLTNGGETVTKESEERIAGTPIDLTVSSYKTGYNFKGWARTPNGDVLTSMIMPEEDITLYAIFKDENAPVVSDKDYETIDGNLELIFKATDDGSGVKEYSITTDPGNPTNWLPVVENASGEIRPIVPGTNTYYVWVRDTDGNFVMYEQTAIKDIIAPTGTIYISGDNRIDDLPYSQTQNVMIDITAEDNECLPSEIKVAIYNEVDYKKIESLSQINFAYAYKEGGIKVDFMTTKGEGLRRIYVIFKDKAGNISMTIKDLDTAEETTYKVNYYVENIEDENYYSYKTETKTAMTQTKVSNQDIIKDIEGMTFERHEITNGTNIGDGFIVLPNGVTEINVYYQRNEYELILNKNEFIDTVTGAETYKYGAEVEITATLKQEAGYDYSFINWTSSDESLVSTQTTSTAKFTMPAGAVTLTANGERTAQSYTVRYYANEGVITETGDADTSRTVTYGGTYAHPAARRTGYTFLGWFTETTGGAQVTDGSTVPVLTSEQKLYAHWKSLYLSKYVEVGDYVDLGISYSNVNTYDGSHKPSLTGWRVMSIDSGDDGKDYVRLVSAGVPLSYQVGSTNAIVHTAASNLANNFLSQTFASTGFSSSNLTSIFSAKNTIAKDANGKPIVKSMTYADAKKVYDGFGKNSANKELGNDVYVNESKFKNMLTFTTNTGNYARYWLADYTLYNGADYLWAFWMNGNLVVTRGRTLGVRPVVTLSTDVITNDVLTQDITTRGNSASNAWKIEIAE